MKLDHNARLPIDAAWLREMHNRVNMDRVMALLTDQVEQRIADGIINVMATEIATDVKLIMCNKELREDNRGNTSREDSTGEIGDILKSPNSHKTYNALENQIQKAVKQVLGVEE